MYTIDIYDHWQGQGRVKKRRQTNQDNLAKLIRVSYATQPNSDTYGPSVNRPTKGDAKASMQCLAALNVIPSDKECCRQNSMNQTTSLTTDKGPDQYAIQVVEACLFKQNRQGKRRPTRYKRLHCVLTK